MREPYAGRLGLDQPHQGLVDDGDRVVAHRQPEGALRGGRVELVLELERRSHQAYGVLHLGQQVAREGSELVVAAGADQELVVEAAPQPRQCRAHRGLAQLEALAGAGHVALLEEDLQREQEVEIGAAECHLRVPSRCVWWPSLWCTCEGTAAWRRRQPAARAARADRGAQPHARRRADDDEPAGDERGAGAAAQAVRRRAAGAGGARVRADAAGRGAAAGRRRGGRGGGGAAGQPARLRRGDEHEAVHGEHVGVRDDRARRAADEGLRRAGAGLHAGAGPPRRTARPGRDPADAARPGGRADRVRVPGPHPADLHRRAGLPGRRATTRG